MDKQIRLENKGIKLTPISSIELRIEFPTINYEIKKVDKKKTLVDSIFYDDEIVSISDRYTVDLSSTVQEYRLNYKVNAITTDKENPKVFKLLESIYNKVTLFILPLLFENKESCSYIDVSNNKNRGYLINSFVSSNFFEATTEYPIYLLLKFSKSEMFKKQEAFFRQTNNFVRNIDVDSNYVAYEFSIPAKFKYDYNLLLNGKYSQISQVSKDRISKFYDNSPEKNIVENILDRNSDLVKEIEKDLDVDMSGIEVCGLFDEKDVLTKDLL